MMQHVPFALPSSQLRVVQGGLAAQEGRQDPLRTPRRRNYRDKDGGRNASGSGRRNASRARSPARRNPNNFAYQRSSPPSVSVPFKKPGFSAQHSLPGSCGLCVMSGHGSPRHQEMPIRNPVGWIQSQVSQKRQRKTHLPSWHHPLQRLEQSQGLFVQYARATPRVLWVWKQRSRSSEKAKHSLLIELRP